MKIKEFEKKLQNTAGDSTKAKIHVEEEKKDAFRVLSHDTSGLKSISSYAGTVRVYMDEHLLFSLVPPRKDSTDCWYIDLYGDITAIVASSLNTYINMLKIANEFMKGQENEN